MLGVTEDGSNWINNKWISIHTPHVGSDMVSMVEGCFFIISIHTPHVGSDGNVFELVKKDLDISIHTPHVGSDQMKMN